MDVYDQMWVVFFYKGELWDGEERREKKKGERNQASMGKQGGLKRVRCVPPSGNYQFKLPYRKEGAMSANHRCDGIHMLT